MKLAYNLAAANPLIIVGIIVLVIVGIAAIAFILVYTHKKSKKQNDKPVAETPHIEIPEAAEDKVETPHEHVDNELVDTVVEITTLEKEMEAIDELLTEAENELYAEEETEEEAPVQEEPETVEPVHKEPVKIVKNTEGKIQIRVRYNRSFTAKIIQADDVLKGYYSEIKNELLRYGKVKSRISWKQETFRTGRKLLAKMKIRGKTLSLYLALNPADYAGTKYKVQDVSAVATNAAVPALYKIKNDRRCKYAKQLIAQLMAAEAIEAGMELNENYAAQYPYKETEQLIEEQLIKLVPWKEIVSGSEVGVITVSEDEITEEIAAAIVQSDDTATEQVEEAEEIEEVTEETPEETPEEEPEQVEDDYVEESVKTFFEEEETPEEAPEEAPAAEITMDVAEADEIIADELVEAFVHQSERCSDKTKKEIVNIDTLGKYFNAGETVTVEEIKKRVPGIGNKVTYIKVLARGKLDKALTVEADDFSPQAIKMIVLTGGNVLRKKRSNG